MTPKEYAERCAADYSHSADYLATLKGRSHIERVQLDRCHAFMALLPSVTIGVRNSVGGAIRKRRFTSGWGVKDFRSKLLTAGLNPETLVWQLNDHGRGNVQWRANGVIISQKYFDAAVASLRLLGRPDRHAATARRVEGIAKARQTRWTKALKGSAVLTAAEEKIADQQLHETHRHLHQP